jgi:hypothetical protein
VWDLIVTDIALMRLAAVPAGALGRYQPKRPLTNCELYAARQTYASADNAEVFAGNFKDKPEFASRRCTGRLAPRHAHHGVLAGKPDALSVAG